MSKTINIATLIVQLWHQFRKCLGVRVTSTGAPRFTSARSRRRWDAQNRCSLWSQHFYFFISWGHL